ncbi:MAG: hypothetical protein ACFFCO_09535 [Promethearchaeota archaeon]
MPKRKLKTSPIQAEYVFVDGPTIVRVEPQDFLDLIAGKDLTIIHTAYKPVFQRFLRHIYVAPDTPITYYTRSKEELAELQVDINAESILSPGQGYPL